MTSIVRTWRASLCAIALAGALPAPSSAASEYGRVIRTERGTCIEGPHASGRVRRMTGQAATSDKPRDPSEDSYPHCGGADDVPAPSPGRGGRR